MKKYLTNNKLRYFLLATTSSLALAVGVGLGIYQQNSQQEIVPETKPDTVVVVDNPLKTITFRNDTLYKGSSTLLYYLHNNITRNYVENGMSYRIQLPYFSHEHKHDDNEKVDNEPRSYRIKYMYSPSQYATLCMFDEITANMAAIETAAFEYLSAKNKDAVIQKYEKTYMKFYFEAVKEGKITPLEFADINELKTRREELENYRSFLVNETQDMWQKKYRAQYSPKHFNMVLHYIDYVGLYQPYNANFKHVMQHMFTIGGVDFSKYLTHFIEPYDRRIKVFDEMAYVKSFTKDKKTASFTVHEVANQYAYLNTFRTSELPNAIQHLFVSAKLKNELNSYSTDDLLARPTLVATSHRKILYELAHDVSFQNFLNETSLNQKPFSILDDDYKYPLLAFSPMVIDNDAYRDKIVDFYQFKGINLTAFIPSFDVAYVPTNSDCFFDLVQYDYLLHKEFPFSIMDMIKLRQNFSQSDQSAPNAACELAENKEIKPQQISPRRLSQNMYMPVLDFKQPLLVPGALSDEAKKKIVQMFNDYDNIPNVFKLCDTEATKQYEKTHGVSGYFTQPDAPFQPVKNNVKKVQCVSRQENIVMQKRISKHR